VTTAVAGGRQPTSPGGTQSLVDARDVDVSGSQPESSTWTFPPRYVGRHGCRHAKVGEDQGSIAPWLNAKWQKVPETVGLPGAFSYV
jgi:hypothetical protein